MIPLLPVRLLKVALAFAWTKAAGVPLILGQVNFVQIFDVCFYRSRGEIDINLSASQKGEN